MEDDETQPLHAGGTINWKPGDPVPDIIGSHGCLRDVLERDLRRRPDRAQRMTRDEEARQTRARAEAMKRLSDADRRAAIDTSDNVIGFDRFSARSQQVALRDGYRRPSGGDQ